MFSFKSFKQKLFLTRLHDFNENALELFHYQAENNSVYRLYLSHLNVNPDTIECPEKIPFLPISFFKSHAVKTGIWREELVYESSGTTGQTASKHFVRDNAFYLANATEIFERFYGPLTNYHCLFLLPSYLERNNSSLVAMASYFVERSGSKKSGFYLHDMEALISRLNLLQEKQDRKILLCGVTFALLELAEKYKPDLSEVMVMETGGMKGRRREMIRAEVHDILKSAFNVRKIHSEYGMTELTSQAYSLGDGKFNLPPWMKVFLRDVNDPFEVGNKKSGGINVIDLAKVHSCAFIETQDLGIHDDSGNLEILGRFDNSDIRGCNLLV